MAQALKKRNELQSELTKVPPHSIEAEQSVLGGLMLDNKAWDKIADCVTEHDFYRSDHRLVFRVLATLANKNHPFDVLTISEELKGINELENAGGEIYLFELANNIPSAANIVAYANIVRERSILRQLVAASGEIASAAFNPDGRDTKALLDDAERMVFMIAEKGARGSGPVDLATLLAEATTRIDKLYHSGQAITGLSTGFPDLDDMTSGLQPGELVIVAGRPSMGKTAFMMNIAEHASIKDEKPVLVFSLEMPGASLAMRMLSSLGHIDQHRVRTGKLEDEDWHRITATVGLLAGASMYIDDTPSLNPTELRSRARRVSREHGQLGLIVVDYLQLMHVHGTKENRTVEVSEISRSLKALAKELNVPVVAGSQLNRGLEQRHDRRPVMSDLRESGSIEQDADLIMFIYRDEVYNEETADKGIAEIIIGKQRNGPIGKIRLAFIGQRTCFESISSDHPEAY